MATPFLRVYLTGPVCAELGPIVVREHQFPGRQSRLLFAFLICQRSQGVTKEELAEAVWPRSLPVAWDPALKSLVSKLRRSLSCVGLSISAQYGGYQLPLPSSAWVDLEAARNAVDEAEGALRRGETRAAWGPTCVALAIARRPFLAGEEGEWIAQQRWELQDVRLRAMDCYVRVCLDSRQPALAAQMAGQALSLEPFRESSYRLLMLAHDALGNRAEALRVYQQCRELLTSELGVDPSPETEALYRELLVK